MYYFYDKGGEAQEQVAQRDGASPALEAFKTGEGCALSNLLQL